MAANLSLYIHIPFCIRKCRYCDFYSVPLNDTSLIERYIGALCREWEFYENSGVLEGASLHTIYVGGGTPSILGIDMWERLNDGLFSRIDKSNVREWSVECNPESYTTEKARVYANSGVTRLTFGIQSLDKRALSICGRAHSIEKAMEVLSDTYLPELFNSIGADIIYALPGQTAKILDNTLASILSIPAVKHLSAYELTIADGTAFARHRSKLKLPAEELTAEMYHLINRRCKERGMRQYEISNYAFSGAESLHNKAYWNHTPYIGLGAAANSYIHPRRWSNIADIEQYISATAAGAADKSGAVDFEEILTPPDLSTEIIFMGLRNADGIDEADFEARTALKLCAEGRGDCLQRYVNDGLLTRDGQKWIPTPTGMLFADMMTRVLMD